MVFRFSYKLVGFLLLFFIFFIERQTLRLFYKFKKKPWTPLDNAHRVSACARRLLRLLQVHVKIEPLWPQGQGRLIVANHLGLIDMMILAAEEPMIFVTSNEMGSLPLIGAGLRQLDCIFVERRHSQQLIADQMKIIEALNSGCNVLLFPEGTSSFGEQVLPFRTGLLRTAVMEPIVMLPVRLKYSDPYRLGLSKETPIPTHLWRIFSGGEIRVRVSPLIETRATKGEPVEHLAARLRTEIALG